LSTTANAATDEDDDDDDIVDVENVTLDGNSTA
jgi:hypothetical protein